MATVMFELPDELLAALPAAPGEAANAIRLAAALFWCSRGELSTGWSARLAGLPYAGFLDAAVRHKVDLFHYHIEDIKREIARPLPEGVDLEATSGKWRVPRPLVVNARIGIPRHCAPVPRLLAYRLLSVPRPPSSPGRDCHAGRAPVLQRPGR